MYVMDNNERNRTETEQKLLRAVTEVVLDAGIKGLGVNRVARKAGCSKMLIYRYFGDFDGLLERWAEENNYWIRKGREQELKELAGLPSAERLQAAASVFRQQIDDTKNNPVMRELLRWQLTETNPVCTHMMKLAEERGLALTNTLAGDSGSGNDEPDIQAVVALVTSGIYYLVLQADFADVFNGVSLEAEDGWQRIGNAAEQIMTMMFERMERNEQKN